jgi:hypothetical protein
MEGDEPDYARDEDREGNSIEGSNPSLSARDYRSSCELLFVTLRA